MDKLPWHIQLEIYKRIDIDTLRALGVKPGKLCVPSHLQEALRRSFMYKTVMPRIGQVIIPVWNTNRAYHLYWRIHDNYINIDCIYARFVF